MKNVFFILALLSATIFCSGCTRTSPQPPGKQQLQVVTTLFPLYDFVRIIGGERVRVSLLLPPGVEAHSFEPKPEDALKLSKADLFVFTSRYMEPWALKFAQNTGSGGSRLLEAGANVRFMPADSISGDKHDHHGDEKENESVRSASVDPHIWLDFDNAQSMVRSIASALIARDPAGEAVYRAGSDKLLNDLAVLDTTYRNRLKNCRSRIFLHGGHYAFGYLARRYGLQYQSASAFSADAEPSPAKLVAMVRQVRSHQLNYIFIEELVSPRISEVIARETGASLLLLHAAHNISRDDLEKGATFIGIMNNNLDNLAKGLQCQ